MQGAIAEKNTLKKLFCNLLVKVIEFIFALTIVVLIIKFAPIKLWFIVIGVAMLVKIITVMFSTRNLERQARHFKGVGHEGKFKLH